MTSRLKGYAVGALLGLIVSQAFIGALVSVTSLLGYYGIGHFRLYYGPDPVGCTKMEYAKAATKQMTEPSK